MTRVLIVDDHAENLYLLRVLLEGHGYTVDEARNGEEAINAARGNRPDLVISDLMMPVMDGFTLLKKWRSDGGFKKIPFIVYTATYTEPRDERLALDLGADAFIIKPAEPDSFMAQIGAVLQKQERGELTSKSTPTVDDSQFLEEHNEILIRKLEKRNRELETKNQELLEEIAERKRNEKELQLRDRAIQAVSQGILITDESRPDHPIIFVSEGFERITGYTQEEVVGRNCRFLQGKETDPETVRLLREAIQEGRPCEVEILNYRKDGTPFWNALSLSTVPDEEGKLAYYVGVQIDVTERRKLEEQLRQSQKMEAVGRLAGGVAHDFNNLLTIITGYCSLLSGLPHLGEIERESVASIMEAGERASALTRQLLGFSRQTMLEPKVLDLNAVIAETGKMLRRLIGEDIQFSLILTPGLDKVRVDPSHLDQVLMNLVVNARDAMPTGGKLTIETANVQLSPEYVALHPDSTPGDHVMLAVSDTGHGMTHEVMERIFEPFFTTKEVGGGTGLGLAMVFGVVKQSGGSIHVYSEPDKGSTFKIFFPAVRAQEGDSPSVDHSPDPGGSEVILLVEDEEAVRRLAVKCLSKFGYHVLTAKNGEDALGVAQSHSGPIDLLLTDVVMPLLSGPLLSEKLRGMYPGLKVLFMSGYTDAVVVRHGLLEANVSFIQKPYTPQALARKVRAVLDSAQTRVMEEK